MMKTILKSELIRLLNLHRESDVVVEFDGYIVPIKGVRYDSLADQIHITLQTPEVNVVKQMIHEKPIRDKVGNA